MKKRLLITSIVMMLVVAVALSTATYAWFTSNTSVTASTVTMTANTSTAQALGIGWDGEAASNTLVFTGTLTVDPMVPTALVNDTTTSGVQFYSSTIKTVAGHSVFNSNGDARTPFTFNNGSEESLKSAFYVKNLSTANSVTNVQVQANIESSTAVYVKTTDTAISVGKTYYTKEAGEPATYTEVAEPVLASIGAYYEKYEATDLIRVAIFKRATAGSGDYVLKGVISNTSGDAACNGTITAGNSAETTGTGALDFATTTVDYIDLGGLDSLQQMDLIAKVWLDGYEFNDDFAGAAATVGLTFYAAPANAKYAG